MIRKFFVPAVIAIFLPHFVFASECTREGEDLDSSVFLPKEWIPPIVNARQSELRGLYSARTDGMRFSDLDAADFRIKSIPKNEDHTLSTFEVTESGDVSLVRETIFYGSNQGQALHVFRSGRLINSINSAAAEMVTVLLSPDHKFVYIVTADKTFDHGDLRVYPIDKKYSVNSLPQFWRVTSAVLSPDGQRLIVYCQDWQAKAIDTRYLTAGYRVDHYGQSRGNGLLNTFSLREDGSAPRNVLSTSVSPDGEKVAFLTDDGQLYVYELNGLPMRLHRSVIPSLASRFRRDLGGQWQVKFTSPSTVEVRGGNREVIVQNF